MGVPGFEARRLAFELHLEALAEFGGGHAREGDRGDLLHLAGAVAHKGHNPVHQRRRLARAGPRFDKETALQIFADAQPRGLVRRIPAEAFPGPAIRDGRVGAGSRFRGRPGVELFVAQKTGSSDSQLRTFRNSDSSSRVSRFLAVHSAKRQAVLPQSFVSAPQTSW